MRSILPRILLLGVGVPGVVAAQATTRLPATYTSIAEIEAALDQQGESGGGGATVQISAPDDLAPEIVVRRRFAPQPNNASVHDDRDEIYQVIAGGGTFVTGGAVVDPDDRPAGIRGGEERQLAAGDFVVIPAGTLHWFRQINGSITYVNTRLAASNPVGSPGP